MPSLHYPYTHHHSAFYMYIIHKRMVWYEIKYGNMIFMIIMRLVTWEIINYNYIYTYIIKIEKSGESAECCSWYHVI